MTGTEPWKTMEAKEGNRTHTRLKYVCMLSILLNVDTRARNRVWTVVLQDPPMTGRIPDYTIQRHGAE